MLCTELVADLTVLPVTNTLTVCKMNKKVQILHEARSKVNWLSNSEGSSFLQRIPELCTGHESLKDCNKTCE